MFYHSNRNPKMDIVLLYPLSSYLYTHRSLHLLAPSETYAFTFKELKLLHFKPSFKIFHKAYYSKGEFEYKRWLCICVYLCVFLCCLCVYVHAYRYMWCTGVSMYIEDKGWHPLSIIFWQADHRYPLAYKSPVLELKACDTLPGWGFSPGPHTCTASTLQRNHYPSSHKDYLKDANISFWVVKSMDRKLGFSLIF